MLIFITGASHTGKTLLAQRLLEKYKIPWLSIDLLKMGLIRSKNTFLTPYDDNELTAYLWPIVREMAKIALENSQSIIFEGCYIPFAWAGDFTKEELSRIKFCCLVMSEDYIRNNFPAIKGFANLAEKRLDDSDCTLDTVIKDNAWYSAMCRKYGYRPVLINDNYEADIAQALHVI